MGIFKEPHWYNSILCYPLGVLWTQIRDKAESIITKHRIIALLSLLVIIMGYHYSYVRKNDNISFYCLWTILFTCTILLCTTKIIPDNPFLKFLGKHVFSIYILQRIPMMILAEKGNIVAHPYSYFIIAFIATIVIALIFDEIIKLFDSLCEHNKDTIMAC